jgi:hypothetical protein
MERRMMLGIKERAERAHRAAGPQRRTHGARSFGGFGVRRLSHPALLVVKQGVNAGNGRSARAFDPVWNWRGPSSSGGVQTVAMLR